MPSLPKKLLRTLPTLTEEVATSPAMAPSDVTGQSPKPVVDEEALIGRILQRLDRTLDEQVQTVVRELLLEQVQTLQPRIRQKVDAAVRKAVTQALAGEGKPSKRTRAGQGGSPQGNPA